MKTVIPAPMGTNAPYGAPGTVSVNPSGCPVSKPPDPTLQTTFSVALTAPGDGIVCLSSISMTATPAVITPQVPMGLKLTSRFAFHAPARKIVRGGADAAS